ncbi:MAG: hypothetical protein ACJAT9_001278, partial [Polaribacter sp.]
FAGKLIRSLSAAVILGISKPLVVLLISTIDEASGVIEVLLMPRDCAAILVVPKLVSSKTSKVAKSFNFDCITLDLKI